MNENFEPKEMGKDGATRPSSRSKSELSAMANEFLSSAALDSFKKAAEIAGSTSQIMEPMRAKFAQITAAYLDMASVISTKAIMPPDEVIRSIQKVVAGLYATRVDMRQYTKIDHPNSTYSTEFTSTEVALHI